MSVKIRFTSDTAPTVKIPLRELGLFSKIKSEWKICKLDSEFKDPGTDEAVEKTESTQPAAGLEQEAINFLGMSHDEW